MKEELQGIDTSVIEELRRIKHEQEVLHERLSRMDGRKEGVSEVVYQRVKSDYESRHAALEEQARPLKDQARIEFGKLAALLEQMAQEAETVRLAREELVFRHELGEFADPEFEEQIEQADARLAACREELEQGQELKERFVAAFHSEEELNAPPPRSTGGRSGRQPRATAEKSAEEARPPARSSAPSPDKTVLTQPPPAPPPGDGTVVAGGLPLAVASGAVATPDATAVLAKPRLITEGDDGAEYPLGFVTTTIGRSPANDICISDDAVSRRHAKIVVGEQGFVVCDLNSENGVYVNGERVKERLLADGDIVEIGPGTRRYVFRAG
ncbi:MAG: FHA domain-containing protein [Acidobacteriota bacterium]